MAKKESIYNYLKKQSKPIIIYGMGDGADKLFEIARDFSIKISGMFASDEFVRHQEFHGFTVKSYREIKDEFGEIIILLAFAVFKDDMIERIIELSKENELYAPFLPMFGSERFDEDFLSKNREKIENVKKYLSDEKSIETFNSIVNYRLTGQIEYLLNIEDKTCIFNDLIPKSNNHTYLDLGAYNGDTALEFDDFSKSKYEKMYLVEPNKKIYPKLEENTKHLVRKLINAACWNENKELNFNAKTGRSAALDESGKDTVSAMKPDDICPYASIIKYDVEGAELEALEGSRNLIQKYTPTLIVSAYHKTTDIFTIPEKVLSINCNYNVYLRHKRYIPDWDTLYYFVKK